MASRSDLLNYTDESFEGMVDLILKLQDDNKALDSSIEELNELVCDLNDRIEHLTELAYP